MLKLLSRGSSSKVPTTTSTTTETKAPTNGVAVEPVAKPAEEPAAKPSTSDANPAPPASDAPATPADGSTETAPNGVQSSNSQPFPITEEPANEDSEAPARPVGVVQRIRRLSFRSFGFFYGRSTTNVATSTETNEVEAYSGPVEPQMPEPLAEEPAAEEQPTSSAAPTKPKRITKADKRASSYALLLRSIIIGAPPPPQFAPSQPSKLPFGKTEPQSIKKLKSELLKPKEANRLIAEVRNLPTPDTSKGVLHGTLRGLNGKITEQDIAVVPSGRMPIHAVCLDCTDEEAEEKHFRHFTSSKPTTTVLSLTPAIAKTDADEEAPPSTPPSIAQADIASVIPVLKNLKVIDLVSESIELVTEHIGTSVDDFGFGKTADKPGVLAGSVPAAETVGTGVLQVGEELFNLGYATSAAVLPDHKGIYPPKDRMSALTYWWGYELVFPPPTMKYLSHAKSIQNSLLNFLTAYSLFNKGVREILPFIRYASQFIDFEWTTIKAQDKGKGVVCAATWIMPAALVPRPWDFEDPPTTAKSSPIKKLSGMWKRTPTATLIVSPTTPEGPKAGPVPIVTLSPPTMADAIVGTDDEAS